MKVTKQKISISLVVPTYNDEETVISLITTCEKILKKYCYDYEIIIGDDDSSDNTRPLLTKHFKQNPRYKLIFNKKNLGIPRNVRHLYFSGKKEYVFLYSADGDWDPNDVERMIKIMIRDHADIVIGKRTKKIGYTPYRHVISFFHKFLPLIMFGVNTIDPGGIKLIKREFIQIPLISTSQMFETEIIIKAKKKHAVISSCPIIYKKIYYGSGKGGNLKDASESVIDLIKLLFLMPFNR